MLCTILRSGSLFGICLGRRQGFVCPRSQGFVSLCSPSLVGHGFGSVPLHSALNPRCCALSFHCGHGFSKAPLAGHPPFPFAGTFRIAVRPFPSFSLQLTLTEPLDQFLCDAKGTGRGRKLAAGHPLGVSQLAPLNLQGQRAVSLPLKGAHQRPFQLTSVYGIP